MLYLAENIKKYRGIKNLTQEDLAEYLGITPQSVSRWERGESYPDITFLPALANILETSIDLLIGMDTIRTRETRYRIHETAHSFMRTGDYDAAEQTYREALLIYPNRPGMMLGLAEALALQGKAHEAISYIKKGLPLSENEKQKATVRAVLCFLYLRCGNCEKAKEIAAQLPHRRESREEILPMMEASLGEEEIDQNVKQILLGDNEEF